MNVDLVALLKRIDYLLIHETTLWLLIVLLGIALASWHLSNVLNKHNARAREANFARKTAIAYVATAAFLFLYNMIMS